MLAELGEVFLIGTLVALGIGGFILTLLLLDRRKYNRAFDEAEKLRRLGHLKSVGRL